VPDLEPPPEFTTANYPSLAGDASGLPAPPGMPNAQQQHAPVHSPGPAPAHHPHAPVHTAGGGPKLHHQLCEHLPPTIQARGQTQSSGPNPAESDFAAALRRTQQKNERMQQQQMQQQQQAAHQQSRGAFVKGGGGGGRGPVNRSNGAATQWVETGSSVEHMYHTLRADARDHARLRNQFYMQVGANETTARSPRVLLLPKKTELIPWGSLGIPLVTSGGASLPLGMVQTFGWYRQTVKTMGKVE
jgi:hypothetical protein